MITLKPKIAGRNVIMWMALIGALGATGIRAAAPEILTSIGPQTTDEDVSLNNLDFKFWDPDTIVTNLVVVKTSSNSGLIREEDIDVVDTGDGTNWWVTITPRPNSNGVSTLSLVVRDPGGETATNVFDVTVTPVPDDLTLEGSLHFTLPDNQSTNVYASVVVSDPDLVTSGGDVTLTLTYPEAGNLGTFFGAVDGSISYTGTPFEVTDKLNNLEFTPFSNSYAVKTTNSMDVSIEVFYPAATSLITSNSELSVVSVNDPPTVEFTISPSLLNDNENRFPFVVTVDDPDLGESFVATLTALNDPAADLGVLDPSPVTVSGSPVAVANYLHSVRYTPHPNVVTNSTEITFEVLVTDAHGGETNQTRTMTLREVNDKPQLSGVLDTRMYTDDATPVTPFASVSITDPDQGGEQQVTINLSVDDPTLGSFSDPSFPPGPVSDAVTWIRAVQFIPAAQVVPVGANRSVTLTIEVGDGVASVINNHTEVAITGVNGAPEIRGMPLSQPLPVPPGEPLPFLNLLVSDDSTNTLLALTISMDNAAKGTLTNTVAGLTGFSETGPGVYAYNGVLDDLNNLLTNLLFEVNGGYPGFPADLFGDTTFRLTVEDELGNLDTEDLRIILQATARNIVVTRTDDHPANPDEGSLRYAVREAQPDDIITFALPSYPAVINLAETNTLVLAKHLTIKGPGADLLTISGDSNSDLLPDQQILRVTRRVILEGLTLSRGLARTGGAVYVGPRGDLIMRECVVADSRAELYGGGIDVDGGALHMDRCTLLRNQTDEATGLAGGAVSIYTDADCSFINTTFVENSQTAPTGHGGGALYVENFFPATFLWVDLQHCTFTRNADATGNASAVYSVGSGTMLWTLNSLFGDGRGRSLEVDAAGSVLSLGGNMADDSTYTILMQGGTPQAVYLLDHLSDLTNVPDLFLGELTDHEGPTPVIPLRVGSPAANSLVERVVAVDQRGRFRDGAPDRGAYEFGALQQVVINEVMTRDAPADFIELYVPRSSENVDLSGFELLVGGTTRHVFGPGTVVKPGHGRIVADALTVIAAGTPLTPVELPSLIPLDLSATNTVTLTTPPPESLPVAEYSYNDNFLSISNVFYSGTYTNDSLTLHPQFLGYAYLPHSFAAIGTSSPGADSEQVPFGAKNAEPRANNDRILVGEDEVALVPVLDNDRDRDRTDTLVVTGVPTNACGASALDAVYCLYTNTAALADTVRYDPRYAAPLQSLAEGVERADGFRYRISDLGGGPITNLWDGGSGLTVIVSEGHRLTTGDVIRITGAGSYDGLYPVAVATNDDQFAVLASIDPAETNGVWTMFRSTAEADVEVVVIGQNDPPVPGPNLWSCAEDEVVRVLGDPDLIGAGATFETDADYGGTVTLASSSLLASAMDIDTDDDASTLKLVGVFDRIGLITGYAAETNTGMVAIHAPGHGLTNGVTVLISGYTGHPSYNDFHAVIEVDEDHFSIPVDFVEDDMTNALPGVWGVLDDGNRYRAVSVLGAVADVDVRADRAETSLIYDPRGSSNLNALAVGETAVDAVCYALEDRHHAISIGTFLFTVNGVNDIPVERPDPDPIDVLLPFTGPGKNLADVISGLTVLDSAVAASGTPDRRDARVFPEGLEEADGLTLVDLWSTTEDLDLVIPVADVLINDMDDDTTDVLMVTTALVSRAGAPVTLNPAGTEMTYRAPVSEILNALAHGEQLMDAFETIISDENGGIVTGTVAILVIGVNDTPIVVDDFDTTPEDKLLALLPLTHPTNDLSRWDIEFDINGVPPDDALWILPQTNALSLRKALVNIDGYRADYDPSVSDYLNQLADWQTTVDQFGYEATDQSLVYACDDLFRVETGGSGFELDVLANDSNFNHRGGDLTIIEVGLPNRNGVVTLDEGAASLTYTPEINFIGDEIFTYTVTDPYGNINRARVTVRVTWEALNGHLQANDDFFAVASGETVVLDVRANDHRLPASGAALTITGVDDSGTTGLVEWSGGAISYTHTGATGTDAFTYTVTAGGTAETTATVHIQVVNRENILPVRDDCYQVPSDSLGNVLDVVRNDRILPGTDILRIVEISAASSYSTVTVDPIGNVLQYTPQPGFNGRDEFIYKVTDDLGGTGHGRVVVLVGSLAPVDDVFTVPFNSAALTTDDGPVNLNVLVNDPVLPDALGSLKIVSVTPAASAIGTMAHTDGELVFTPAEGVSGSADFVYRMQDVSDGDHRTAEAVVTVTVEGEGVYANPDTFQMHANQESIVLDVLVNDATVRAVPQNLTLTGIGTGPDAPNHGGAVVVRGDNAGLIYTPAEDFVGEETFTYHLTDSLGTDSAKVVVRVNKPEIAACEDAYIVYYDSTGATEFSLPVLDNDTLLPDAGGLLLITGTGMDDPTGTHAPSHQGTVSIAPDTQSLWYTPDTNYAGSFPYEETFTYEISDGSADRMDALVRVLVRQRSGALNLDTKADRYSVERDSTGNLLPVLANDGILPATADAWSITSVSDPDQEGIVAIAGRALQYTPLPGFIGTERFGYTVSDGLGGTATGGVAVVVGDILLNQDCFTVLSGPQMYDLDVLHNDGVLPRPDFDLILGDAMNPSLGGMLSVSNSLVRYGSDPAYAGPYPYWETFDYTVLDDSLLAVTQSVSVLVLELGSDSDTGTVFITVTGVNDPPTITNDTSVVQITDKQAGRPFTDVAIDEVDEQHQEQIWVTVKLDDPARGRLRNLSGFVEIATGVYSNSGTAADMNASIHELIFDPTENRITVPTSEVTVFTIEVSDHKWPSVITDTSSRVEVTAVNDSPQIQGTVAGQKVYYRSALRPFTGVTVLEVDDLTLQPLDLTVSVDIPEQGYLSALGGFGMVTGGVYRIEGVTAEEASTALRNLSFVPTAADRLPPGGSETTRLTISVDDRFAAPEMDSVTTVVAHEGFTAKLLAGDGGENDQFGFAVAAQRDQVVAGAPFADPAGNDSGGFYVYDRAEGGPDNWGKIAQPLPATLTPEDRLGAAVALEGDLAAVGAPFQSAGGIQSGVVYLFERNQGGADSWGSSGYLLPVDGSDVFVGASGDRFGTSVALSGDLLAVGAPQYAVGGTSHGAVFLYGRNQGGADAWGLVARVLPPGGDNNDQFGASVALDGPTLVVGAPGDDSQGGNAGTLYAFARDEGGLNAWGAIQKFQPPGNNAGDELGRSVTLDGDWLAGGAPEGDTDDVSASGMAYVYRRTAPGLNGWTFQNACEASDAKFDADFGFSVAMENGLLAIGAPRDDSSDQQAGAVYIFAQDVPGFDPGTQLEKRVPPDPDILDEFGYALSLNEGILAIGARRLDVNNGALFGGVYIYELGYANPPLAGEPLDDQVAVVNLPFTYTLPAGAFGDPDAGDALVLSAVWGGPGPVDWLSFDPLTATFSGLPTVQGSAEVVVTAEDELGHTVSQFFTIWTIDPALPVTLPNPRLEAWRRTHFPPSALADPGQEATVWGNGANGEGDPLTVIEEYFFGYDPNLDDAPSGPMAIDVSTDPNCVEVSFNRRTDDPLLVYEVDYANQLGNWMPAETLVIGKSVVPISPSFERVTLKLSKAGLTARFYRVRGWMLETPYP